MPHKQGCALVCAYTLHKENETQKRADAFTSSRAQLPWWGDYSCQPLKISREG